MFDIVLEKVWVGGNYLRILLGFHECQCYECDRATLRDEPYLMAWKGQERQPLCVVFCRIHAV